MIGGLPRPQLDKPVVKLSAQAVGALRGVGGLAKGAPASAALNPLSFPFATTLPEIAESTRGFWAREFIVENPVR